MRGLKFYLNRICDVCGDLKCEGQVWCEQCGEYHHAEPCADLETLEQRLDETSLLQAALDAQHCAGLEAANDQAAYCRYGY